MILLNILIIILFASIAYQDFHNREVSWFLFPLAFVAVVVNALIEHKPMQLLGYFGINALFVTLQMAILFLVYAIKHRRFVNIVNTYIGAGDLIFFLLLCAGFSPLFFGVYFLSSLILLTILYLLKQSVEKESGRKDIPLAGGLSVSYVIMLLAGFFYTGFDLYNDLLIGDLFIGK